MYITARLAAPAPVATKVPVGVPAGGAAIPAIVAVMWPPPVPVVVGASFVREAGTVWLVLVEDLSAQ